MYDDRPHKFESNYCILFLFSYCCADLNGALLVKSRWDLCHSDSVRQEEKAFNEGCLREIPRKKLDFGVRVCVCVCLFSRLYVLGYVLLLCAYTVLG